jgi:hypothetical protein
VEPPSGERPRELARTPARPRTVTPPRAGSPPILPPAPTVAESDADLGPAITVLVGVVAAVLWMSASLWQLSAREPQVRESWRALQAEALQAIAAPLQRPTGVLPLQLPIELALVGGVLHDPRPAAWFEVHPENARLGTLGLGDLVAVLGLPWHGSPPDDQRYEFSLNEAQRLVVWASPGGRLELIAGLRVR